MLGKEMFKTQFAYNAWANKHIFDQAALVTEEQFNEASMVGERSLRQILIHMVQIERVWRLLARDGQVEPSQLPSSESLPSAKAMQAVQTQEQQKMESLLSTLNEADLAAQMTIKRWDGVEVVMMRWHMLSHLLLHSMQHRSEAAVLLTQYGRSPGDIDFLFFTFAS